MLRDNAKDYSIALHMYGRKDLYEMMYTISQTQRGDEDRDMIRHSRILNAVLDVPLEDIWNRFWASPYYKGRL